ncbi:MAG: hypothetical protein AB1349_01680 [Elusimicrobiota bacterium]
MPLKFGVSKDSFNELKNFDFLVLQQDVPWLDSDFNEMQEIFRNKRIKILQDLYQNGVNGVPEDDFKISASAINQTQNFLIKKGRAYINGKILEQHEDFEYIDRANVLYGVTRFEQDIDWSKSDIWLWLYPEEILITEDDDPAIVNAGFGETCGRKKIVNVIYPDYTGADLSATKGIRLAKITPQSGGIVTEFSIQDLREEKKIHAELAKVIDQTDIRPDTTEQDTWDGSIDTLLNNLNRIRSKIKEILGGTNWKDPYPFNLRTGGQVTGSIFTKSGGTVGTESPDGLISSFLRTFNNLVDIKIDGTVGSDFRFAIRFPDGSEYLTIKANGYVGIKQPLPSYGLDVNESARIVNDLYANHDFWLTNRFLISATDRWWSIERSGQGLKIRDNNVGDRLTIDANGILSFLGPTLDIGANKIRFSQESDFADIYLKRFGTDRVDLQIEFGDNDTERLIISQNASSGSGWKDLLILTRTLLQLYAGLEISDNVSAQGIYSSGKLESGSIVDLPYAGGSKSSNALTWRGNCGIYLSSGICLETDAGNPAVKLMPAGVTKAYADNDGFVISGRLSTGHIYQPGYNYIYPGRAENSASQSSWYLASHGSYGLYSNTGLYLGGDLWCGTIASRGYIESHRFENHDKPFEFLKSTSLGANGWIYHEYYGNWGIYHNNDDDRIEFCKDSSGARDVKVYIDLLYGHVVADSEIRANQFFANSTSYLAETYLNGILWMQDNRDIRMGKNAVLYPGRVDGSGGYQSSWYLGSHSSYGLYTNTGLYIAGSLWVAGTLNATVSYASRAGYADYAYYAS